MSDEHISLRLGVPYEQRYPWSYGWLIRSDEVSPADLAAVRVLIESMLEES